MRVLAVDSTSSRHIYIAVSNNDAVQGIAVERTIGQGDDMIVLMHSALSKAGITASQIDCFGVCTGPGSFTGIRVGLSAVKALTYAGNKPVIGFSSLAVVAAASHAHIHDLVCVIEDAHRNNYYCGLFMNSAQSSSNGVVKLLNEKDLWKFLTRKIKKHQAVQFCGDGVHPFVRRIKDASWNYTFGQVSNHNRIQSLVSLTHHGFFHKKKQTAFSIGAYYLYPRDCQVQRKRKP